MQFLIRNEFGNEILNYTERNQTAFLDEVVQTIYERKNSEKTKIGLSKSPESEQKENNIFRD